MRDAVVVERQHEHAKRPADVGVRVLGVVNERGLEVGSRVNQAVGVFPALREGVGYEVPDRRVALVLGGLGRHREARVLGEQRDDRLDLVAIEGLREPRYQLLLLG